MAELKAYERGFSPSMPNRYGKLPWSTLCDGMPTLMGCGAEIETSVPYKRPGTKKSGWLLVYGHDGYKEDRSYLCAFCPSCAEVVREQMKKEANVHDLD